MPAYHDTEWGVPRHDERTLFEFLILEGAQAGLSWRTILAKRDGYRAVFAGFDVDDRRRLRPTTTSPGCLADPGIVRNRAKVAAHDRQRPRRAGPADGLGRRSCGASSTARRCRTRGRRWPTCRPRRRRPTG